MAISMNPTASFIGDAEFSRLSAEEIKRISVKKIQVVQSFDQFLQPTPGGLHDPALGPILDKSCATCHMNSVHCSGHPGHIELAVPCYHPSFVDQVLRILRAKCVFCHRLRMPRQQVNLFACKLRLLQHGLVDELEELDDLRANKFSKRGPLVNGVANGSPSASQGLISEDEDEDEDEEEQSLLERRQEFVRQCIMMTEKGDSEGRHGLLSDPVAVAERRVVIKAFWLDLNKAKQCHNCKGISPSFKKDSNLNIFRKALPRKQRDRNASIALKTTNPLIYRQHLEGFVEETENPLVNGSLKENTGLLDRSGNGARELHGAEEEIANNAAFEDDGKDGDDDDKQHFLTATEVRAALDLLIRKEQDTFNLIYNSRPRKRAVRVTADMFFITTLLVSPNRFRPARPQGEMILQAQENTSLVKILQANDLVREIQYEMQNPNSDASIRPRGHRELVGSMAALQKAVNRLIDQVPRPNRRETEQGVRQILEKKEGLFRMNLMGKRVNFAARSVISPDPNIETNEIGVPLVFARRLTYPQSVTTHNFSEMKQAVINGVEKYPGATAIESENGRVLNLRFKNLEQRIALAHQLLSPSVPGLKGGSNKKVYRHLQTGDVVVMNRQPTLHKPSMMGHRARVLSSEKTIRMHYANCNTYNADFDGDEMNMHLPQSEVARTEALQIADTDHQYLSATAGAPLRGLIQDHISMGVQFTSRDVFFNQGDYQQLLYSCIRPENYHTIYERILTLPPAILKPTRLWTGKQVISTVLKNITPRDRNAINFIGRSSIPGQCWGDNSEEGEVVFKHGELIHGVLDKSQLGPRGKGLIDSIHELYGHIAAGKLLSVLGRLLTRYLNMRGWTCGVDDLHLNTEGEAVRQNKLSERRHVGSKTASTYVGLGEQVSHQELFQELEDVLRDDEKQYHLDKLYSARMADLSSQISKNCLPDRLAKSFPRNQMQAMTLSGAKGSSVNANFISCNLGQQVLEGRRVPSMVSGKTLPSFRAFDTDPSAGGYVAGRFLTGIKPQEYYFHAMAGREGLIDTAVKTSTSGYLQRCVVKGLEGLKTEYDHSVREASNGALVQFLYGEDGLDITKQKHLAAFSFLAQNQLSLMASTKFLQDQETLLRPTSDSAAKYRRRVKKMMHRSGDSQAMDPVTAVFSPGSSIGSTSESFHDSYKAYVDANPDNLIRRRRRHISGHDDIAEKDFQNVMDMKYMKSLADPGEAVGIIAAQSIGEPSTQMTLNTFHLAGHAAKNVTLGIPRLREIVMRASRNISTPRMILKPIAGVTEAEGVSFAKRISKLALSELVSELSVKERRSSTDDVAKAKIFDITIVFFSAEQYMREYSITVEDVSDCLKNRFIPQLEKSISSEFKKKTKDASHTDNTAAVPVIGESVGRIEEAGRGLNKDSEVAGGEDDVADEDIDPDDAKQSRRRQNEEYDDPDEDEAAFAASDPEVSSDEDDGDTRRTRRVRTFETGEDDDDGATSSNDHDSDDQSQIEDVVNRNSHLVKYKFSKVNGEACQFRLAYNASTPKVLLLPIVERCLHVAVVHSIPGLSSCVFSTEHLKDPQTGQDLEMSSLTTEGVNLSAAGDFQDIIDPYSVYTNSVHHMLRFYGIEAARKCIIREIDGVFKSHSISVDNRHLNLIADAMTYAGDYQGMSRYGLIQNSGSSLAKMSFETVLGFLKEAVLDHGADSLRGPSSRIVVGKRGTVGTGAFEVVVPVGGEVDR